MVFIEPCEDCGFCNVSSHESFCCFNTICCVFWLGLLPGVPWRWCLRTQYNGFFSCRRLVTPPAALLSASVRMHLVLFYICFYNLSFVLSDNFFINLNLKCICILFTFIWGYPRY